MKYCAEVAEWNENAVLGQKSDSVCSSVHVPRTADGSAAAGEDGHEVEDEDAGSATAAVGAACIIGTSEAAAVAAASSPDQRSSGSRNSVCRFLLARKTEEKFFVSDP